VTRPLVCTIGTTDPWNAAGVGLDQRILWECGARPALVVAAVSVQTMDGVEAVVDMEPETIQAQWNALATASVAAVRVGALCGEAATRAVAEILAATAAPSVYDPVFAATGGGRFADDATIAAARSVAVRATIVTPNRSEAAALTGIPVESVDDMERAGNALVAAGSNATLVTGGDARGDPVDVLVTRDGSERFGARRIEREMRGTGCVLAASLAAELAKGARLRDAVMHARAFVREKIAGAVLLGGAYVAE